MVNEILSSFLIQRTHFFTQLLVALFPLEVYNFANNLKSKAMPTFSSSLCLTLALRELHMNKKVEPA